MPEPQVIKWIVYAVLLLYVAFDATGQGKFADLTREVIVPAKQPAVNFILHWLYPAKYVLVTGLVALLTWRWQWLLIPPLLRLAAFDPVFQWSRGDKLFSLGTSSHVDRLLSHASWLSPALRVVALLGSVALLFFL